MQYIKHYNIECDELYQLAYTDNVVIPLQVEIRDKPFPDIKCENEDGLIVHKIPIQLK